ncbi:hypothetical protein JHK86_050003 [Glycine max]|nr:hypothetical protein JHK86_050003 [Glycine max]
MTPMIEADLVDLTASWGSKGGKMSLTEDGVVRLDGGACGRCQELSLRNFNLQGAIPDFSRISHLTYLDVCSDLSNNKLNGTISSYFSGLARLQKL